MNNPMSQEVRTKIAGVVEAAFKATTRDGEDPTSAVAKEATASKLTVNQTKRACEAVNVSLTHHHNKTASSNDRAKGFDIASVSGTLDKMFPSKKQVSVKEANYAVAADAYDLDEQYAPEAVLDTVVREAVPRSADAVYKQAADAVRSGEAMLDEVETLETATLLKSEEQLAKIARMVEGYYGDSSASIEDEGIREYVNSMISKSASERPVVTPSESLINETEVLSGLLKLASDQAEVTAEVKQEVECLKKLSADYTSGNVEDGPMNTNFKLGPIDAAKLLNPAIGGFMRMKTMSPKARRQISENFSYNPVNDKKFADVIQTRGMLQNAVMLNGFMRNDDVLSKAKPEKVVGAFNDIFANLPQLSDNPELTRSALRHAVEYGGMDFPTMLSAMKDSQKILGSQSTIDNMRDSYSSKNTEDEKSYGVKVKAVEDLLQKQRDDVASEKKNRAETKKDRRDKIQDAQKKETQDARDAIDSEEREKQKDESDARAEEAKLQAGVEAEEAKIQAKEDKELSRKDSLRSSLQNVTQDPAEQDRIIERLDFEEEAKRQSEAMGSLLKTLKGNTQTLGGSPKSTQDLIDLKDEVDALESRNP